MFLCNHKQKTKSSLSWKNFIRYYYTNRNHRVYRFQLILMKFPNLHTVWTAGKNLELPDKLSRNTPPELLTRKTTVEIPKNIKFYLAKDETSPRLECKYAVKTELIDHK